MIQLEELGNQHRQREPQPDAQAVVQHAGGRRKLGADRLPHTLEEASDAWPQGHLGRGRPRLHARVHAYSSCDGRVAPQREREIGYHPQGVVRPQAVKHVFGSSPRAQSLGRPLVWRFAVGEPRCLQRTQIGHAGAATRYVSIAARCQPRYDLLYP